MPHWIDEKEFAERAEVQIRTVYNWRRSGKLDGAYDAENKKYDLHHPAVKLLIGRKNGEDFRRYNAKKDEKKTKPNKKLKSDGVPPIEQLYDLTIAEIVESYGNFPGCMAYIKAMKELEQAMNLKIKNQSYRGDLIEREQVKKYIFAVLDVMLKRLLGDVPSTLANEISVQYNIKDKGKIRKMVHDKISSTVRDSKKITEKLG